MRGSIRRHQRADGVRYEAVVPIGLDPKSGKRRWKSRSFRTRKEADAGLRKMIAEAESGALAPKSMTVGDLLTTWLETEAQHRVRDTTLYFYRNLVHHQLIPGLGTVPLAKLTPTTIQGWYSKMLASGGTKTMVRHCHGRLRQALKMAYRQGLVASVATERVSLPREERKPRVLWTPEELGRFREAAKASRFHVAYELLVCCGFRRAELLGLGWESIDLARGTLQVRETYSMHGSTPRLTPTTKTPSSRRLVRLPATLLRLLQDHKDHQEHDRDLLGPEWRGSGRVVTNQWGGPCHPDTLRDDLGRVITRAGVPHLPIHGFRHLSTSILIEHGAPLPQVQARLGHKDSSVTLDVYTHQMGADRTAEVMEGALFSQ